MKLLIASDIHGDIDCLEATLKEFNNRGCDRLLLLGDLLYHGPRNDLPVGYAPKKVIERLNGMKERILAVRGNCDTEVDQMVLDFPILADYALLHLDGVTVFATHGHIYNAENPPALFKGEILLHGHTHLMGIEQLGGGIIRINPGSVSLPKGGNPKTFAIYENGEFSIFDFNGNEIANLALIEKT